MFKNKKNKIVFLVPSPIGISPSQRFRFEQYLELLKENEVEPLIFSFWNEQTFINLYGDNLLLKISGLITGIIKRIFHLIYLIPLSNLVFIHREVLPVGPPIFEFIICKIFNKKIIYDFDDAIWMSLTSKSNRIASYFKYPQKVSQICKLSHKISCGNSFLGNFARIYNENVIINPTTIDTDNQHNRLKKHSSKKTIVIGWTGTHSNFVYLETILPALKEMENNNISFTFRVIANINPKLDLKSFEFIKWKVDTEIEDLMSFDIGVMPLDEKISDLSKGKCGFKALQYMALGIPPVVSPVGINVEIIEINKTGFIANNNQWYEILLNLINDFELRNRIGADARKYIIDNYSVLSNSKNFLNLFVQR